MQRLIFLFLALATWLLAACATGPAPTREEIQLDYSGSEEFVRLGPGSFRIIGRPVDDFMSRVVYDVSHCRGRVVSVEAEYRTHNLRIGPKEFHGAHVDYIAFYPKGPPRYPANWHIAPSPRLPSAAEAEWVEVSRSWRIPADAERVLVRIGLQASTGVLEVRQAHVFCS